MFVSVVNFTFADVKKQYTPDAKTITIPDGVTVEAVSTAINSFSFSYQDDDHHISAIQVTTGATLISATQIEVTLQVNCRDAGGGDEYEGSVDVLVLGTQAMPAS